MMQLHVKQNNSEKPLFGSTSICPITTKVHICLKTVPLSH